MQRAARGFLMVVSVLNGLAGLICGVLFLAGPDGHLLQAGALLPVIATLPLAAVFFRDFTWIGVAMLLVLGLPNVLAAVMLLRRSFGRYRTTLGASVLLIAWCGFELAFMPNALAVGYLVVGAVSAAFSLLLLRPADAGVPASTT